MKRELTLVGVESWAEINDAFCIRPGVEVSPPDALLDKLGQGRVGVELAPSTEVEVIALGGIYKARFAGTELAGAGFYAELEQRLTERGVHIERIIDDTNQAEMIAAFTRLIELRRKAQELRILHDKMLSLEEEREKEHAALQVEYARKVQRPHSVLRNAAELGLDALVVSKHLAERIFQMGVPGYVIGQYLYIEPNAVQPASLMGRPDLPAPSVGSRMHDYSSITPNAGIHRLEVQSQEWLERRYRAFEAGRVLEATAPEPDFIGTFNCRVAELGLFELHVGERVGNEFTGQIFDVEGDASVFGTIGPEGQILTFTKIYDPSNCSGNAVMGEIRYEVLKSDGQHFDLRYRGNKTGGGAYMVRFGQVSAEHMLGACRSALGF